MVSYRRIAASFLAATSLVVVVGELAAADATGKSLEERLEKTRTDLRSSAVDVRRAAIKSLIHSELSPKMLAEMRAALKDKDGEVRGFAGTAVGNLGAAAVPAIPDLVVQLKSDSHKEARETAARALGRIGKASAEGGKTAIAPLTEASKADADPVTRVVALGALAMMEVDVPGQIQALRTHLAHEDAMVRMKAAHALGMLGTAAKAASAEIVVVLQKETDAHRRGYVARAVGNVGDAASLPALLAAYAKETDAGSRGEMRGAIAKLGGKAPE